jgi:pyruvate,water dikinase
MEMQFVNGYGYLSAFVHGAPRKGNGKPPPGLLIKLISRVPPSARRRIKIAQSALERDLGMLEVERWDDMRPGWIERCLEVQDVDVEACSDQELAAHVRRAYALLIDGFRLHFELLSQVIPVGEYLVRTEAWGIEPEVAAKAAFHGVRTTAEARGRLDAIAAALGDAEVADLDAMRSHSDEAAQAVDEYLRHHGTWLLADDVHNPTISEFPNLVFRTIQQHRGGALDERAEIDAAVAACRSAIDPADHDELDTAMARAQRAYAALDDNSGLLAAWPGGLVHRALAAAARRLETSGVLVAADDVWVLTPGEVADLLEGTSTPNADEIHDRVLLRAAQATLTPPQFLGSPPSPPPDPGLFPEPVGRFVGAFTAFLSAKFGDHAADAVGVGDQPVTGRAVVALTPGDALERIEPGDVLVTGYTTPAFNVVMPILAGVVTASGGANSHTAVVARELGIPAVVGLADALDRISDGATVTVDPVAATVTVLS